MAARPGARVAAWGIAALLGVAGCGDGASSGPPSAPDAGRDAGPDLLRDRDGDGIHDVDELGPDGTAVDTDGDGTPDVEDLDSDDDGILDRHEGALDFDGDGVPNFRDLDSDGDGTGDRVEAGDDDPSTPPVGCDRELDSGWAPGTGEWAPGRDEPAFLFTADGLVDFVDVDSDGDAVSDEDERREGTDPCDPDSDADGVLDVLERAYARAACPAAAACECAVDADCRPPDDWRAVAVPFVREDRRGFVDLTSVAFEVPHGVSAPVDVRVRAVDVPQANDGVDTSRFFVGARPSCAYDPAEGVVPEAPCWDGPGGLDAVERVDESTFFGVTPGTRVHFDLTLENRFAYDELGAVYALRLDLVGDTVAVDSRHYLVVVWRARFPGAG